MRVAGPAERRAILVGTRNAGKRHELWPLLEVAGFQPVSLDDLGLVYSTVEDGLEVFATFEENALAKARWYHRASARNGELAVLADDSGLAVDALAGAPGVRSKRWSGGALDGRALDDENNRTLLRALAGQLNRRAQFVCAAAIVWQSGERVARGEIAGTIVDEPRGDNGFGYDPHFLSDELAMTLAEATLEEKSRVSHRARAVRAVLAEYANVDRACGVR